MKVISFIKKMLLGVFGIGILFFPISSNYSLANNEMVGFGSNTYVSEIGVPGAKSAETDGNNGKLIDVIKKFINIMLGSLATIALVICLYAGFKMVTAGSDDGKYKDGFKLIKNAGLGLLIIGLSWMIVSFIMWVIQNLTAETEP